MLFGSFERIFNDACRRSGSRASRALWWWFGVNGFLQIGHIFMDDTREERLEEALQRIVQWSEAYPPDLFPEPDWKKAAQLLNAGGMTLDRISGACMRHVVQSVGEIAREALKNDQSQA